MNILIMCNLHKIRSIFFKIFLLLIILLNVSYANDKFYIKDIKINNINDVPKIYIDKLFLYKNKNISNNDINKFIKSIYKTEIFKNINIYVKKDILIINLEKNLIINLINLSNNKFFNKNFIEKILKKHKLINNEFFNERKIFKFKFEMINLYNDIGKYNTDIKFNLKKTKNKIDILINFYEGDFSRISNFNIIGNNNFKKDIILKKLEINNYIWKKYNSIYKRKIFTKNLYKLSNFYKDNGYLNFYIKKLDIKFNKNTNYVNINLSINEGYKFLIKNYNLYGDFDSSYLNDLKKICNFKNKEIYNDSKLKEIKFSIQNFFINKGYKNPEIKINIKFDKQNKKLIILNFNIISGKRLMVRNINIFGNKYISDNIIRKNISHTEYSELSYEKINNDILKLSKLKYFNDINIKIKEINKNKDVVDIIYNVKEINFNRFNAETNIRSKKSNFSFSSNQINWLGSESSILMKIKYNKPEYDFLINIENSFPFNKNENKINSSFFKKLFIIKDDFNKIIINNKSLLNSLTIPIKNNYFHKYEILFEKNSLLNSNLNKFNTNNLLKKRFFKKRKNFFLKKNNLPILIKNKNFFGLTKIGFNNLNNLFLPSSGNDTSLLINNSFPISSDEFYKIFLNINNFYKINYKNLIINNKIQFFLINSKKNKEIPISQYLYSEIYLNKVRGFDYNYMSYRFNAKKDITFKKNKKKKINKSNSQLFLINELLLPNIFFKQKFKNTIQISLFLDMSLNLHLSKNSFSKNKNIYIKNIRHKHLSAGINIKWLSPVGLIKTYYAVPILKCNGEKINNFKCGFSI